TQSGDFGNYLLDFAEGRWTPENPTAEKPRTFNREDEYWISQANTYWYRSTDYLRLKNVQVGYTLPSNLVNRVGLKSARFYVNAVNLITWDQFDVFDPETDNQDGTVYPQKKVYNVAVNLTFYEKSLMKKIAKLFFAAAIAIATSCNTDFMNVEPRDRLTDAAVWSDPALVEAFVNEMYRGLNHGIRELMVGSL